MSDLDQQPDSLQDSNRNSDSEPGDIIIRKKPEKFLVAFSVTGEEAVFIEEVAEVVEQQLGWESVFFYKWFPSELATTDADLTLLEFYIENSELVTPCFSKAYSQKRWTKLEWRYLRSWLLNLPAEEKGRVLPVSFDPNVHDQIEGLVDIDITFEVDIQNHAPGYIAEHIVNRLRDFVPEAGKLRVYLADVLLDDDSMPVNRSILKAFLEEECDCYVLPDDPDLIDRDTFESEARALMKTCDVFVQLLAPNPWRGGQCDAKQFLWALEANLPCYCFRDFELKAIKENQNTHYDYIKNTNAIQGQFDDFFVYLKETLEKRKQEKIESVKAQQHAERICREGSDRDDNPEQAEMLLGQLHTMPHSVFLSHNANDKSFVRRIARDLTLAGITVWLDEAEIKLGDSLLAKITAGINGSDYLAVILSPNSVESSWVQRELQIAITEEIVGKTVKVLPLLYRDCQMPAFLTDKLYADFRDETDYDTSLRLLLDRLGGAVPANPHNKWLVGRWKGEWYWRQKHRSAEMEISPASDECQMLIQYTNGQTTTIVEQQLSVKINGDLLDLAGMGYRFLERGNAIGYHLDSFALQSSSDHAVLRGSKIDKRGINVPVKFERLT